MATASGVRGPKQTSGYYVPLASCVGKIYKHTAGTGAGGSFLPGSFADADWAKVGGTAGPLLSTISSIGQGGLLKDMGKTVVSSNRTFRKVQLVVQGSANSSTFTGVGGSEAKDTAAPYFTGYIELATGNSYVSGATPAPVAFMPGLL